MNYGTRRPAHVALVSPTWPPGSVSNGVITYVANVRQGMQEEGVSSIVLSVMNQDAPQDPAAIYLEEERRKSRPLALAVSASKRLFKDDWAGPSVGISVATALRRLPKAQRPEVLEMEESFGAPAWAQLMLDIPIVTRLHGPWFVAGPADNVVQDHSFRARVIAEGRAFRGAVAVTSPAREQLDKVRAYYQIPLEHAVVIPNPGPTVDVSERWSYAACDKKTILCVGRFDLRKGADIVVRAFRELAARLPDVELLMVGPGTGIPNSRGENVLPEAFLDAELEPSIRKRVRWLGPRPLSEIPELRRRSFVTVVASRYENHPLAVLEALAYGGPLIASRTGGIPEIVEHGRSGLLFESEDAPALAQGLFELCSDPGFAARLGEEGGRVIQADYSPRTVARTTLDYYASRLDYWRHLTRRERSLTAARTLLPSAR